MPSLSEQFLKNFLSEMYVYQMGNKPLNETDTFSFFVDRLYKDFKTHDFDEFELQFLDTVLNIITFEPLLKKVINNFDFLLYLLNRRLKPQEICLKKFYIIDYLYKSTEQVDSGLKEQFKNYINKGPY